MSALEGQRQTENTSAEQEQGETEDDRYFKWAELVWPQHSWALAHPLSNQTQTSCCASESANGSRKFGALAHHRSGLVLGKPMTF